MDEARRFLRQLTPGVVFLVEVVMLIGLAAPDILIAVCGAMAANAALVAGTGLLGIPTVGVILSSLHHVLLGCPLYSQTLGMRPDQRNLLSALGAEVWGEGMQPLTDFGIVKVGQAGSILHGLAAPSFDVASAAIITTALWHERVDSNPIIKGVNPRNNSINDIMHGLCAEFVGSVAALGIALAVYVTSVVLSFNVAHGHLSARSSANYAALIAIAALAVAVVLTVLTCGPLPAKAVLLFRRSIERFPLHAAIACLIVGTAGGYMVRSLSARSDALPFVILLGAAMIVAHHRAARRLIEEHRVLVFSWMLDALQFEMVQRNYGERPAVAAIVVSPLDRMNLPFDVVKRM